MKSIYKANTCREDNGLQGLNLINSFLFGVSTEKPENAEFIAKLIIERATGKKVGKISVTPEKSLLGIDIGNHGIRMDLYIEEYENEQVAKIYDIEPNNYPTKELPMRSRYSQALTDVKLLEAGQRYRTLPNYISIWILPYDPFGQNRMLYTVKNCVVEDSRIMYNDGVMKLFLYTGGEFGGNENLKNLLHYFSNSEKENVVDPELSRLHSIVENARSNQKVGEHYMTLQDYLDCEIERGVEEGIAKVIEERVAEAVEERVAEAVEEKLAQAVETATAEMQGKDICKLICTLKDFQIPDVQILEKVMEKYNLSEEKAQAYLNEISEFM